MSGWNNASSGPWQGQQQPYYQQENSPYGYPPPPAGYPSGGAAPATGYYPSSSGATSYYGQGGSVMSGYGKPQRPAGFDVEAQNAATAAAAFAETKVRTAFVRKVFVLVFIQLAITIGIACVFMFVKPVKEYVAGVQVPCPTSVQITSPNAVCYENGDGRWVFYTSWALTFVMLIALMCSTTLRRKHPWNYLALFAFTFVMSVQVGCIVAFWDVSVVLIAFAVTGGSVLGLTLGALFIPWDITKKGHVLGMAAFVVLFMALITFLVGFFYVNKWWYLTLSVIIALLFAAFLVYDIQMVVGKGQHKISPDEYVFAAVQIYLDIVIMFLNVRAYLMTRALIIVFHCSFNLFNDCSG